MKTLKLSKGDIKAGWNKFIDSVGLYLLGILSLGYVLFYSSFAKLHFYLSCLKTPIFIGEIVFAICLLLFVLKWSINPKKTNIFTYLFLLYFGFVIIKTVWGYFIWGPLSFRHAVLFCYPLFAFFSFSFYKNNIFDTKKSTLFILLILIILKTQYFHIYFVETLVIIALMFIISYPTLWTKILFLVVLSLVIPYKSIFQTSRTFLLSNSISGLYVMAACFFALNLKNKYKKLFLFLFVISFILGFLFYADKNQVRSVFGFKNIINYYNRYTEQINEKRPMFSPKIIEVKLFNPKTATMQQLLERSQIMQELFRIQSLESELYKELAKSTQQKSQLPIVSSGIKNAQQKPPIIKNPEQPRPGTVLVPFDEQTRIKQSLLQIQARKIELQKQLSELEQQNKLINFQKNAPEGRDIDNCYVNSLFRILIWQDVLKDIKNYTPWLGFSFGKPFRSENLEILSWAGSEWERDGWICIHNSYLDIVYRAGIFGIIFIIIVFIYLFKMIKKSILLKSYTGILLTGILLNWFIAANFLEILEMPYSAIPLWSLFGLTFAYLFKDKAL